MAKPPPATPHSDIGGVHRDMRVDRQPIRGDPDQGDELAQRSAEDRARPPQNSEPERKDLAPRTAEANPPRPPEPGS